MWRQTSDSHAADKGRLLARLRCIEGQSRGLVKMVEDDRRCIDILEQIASLRAAADAAALILVRDHLQECVHQAALAGEREKIDEAVDVVRWYRRS